MRTLKQVVGIDVGSKELVVCLGNILANLDKSYANMVTSETRRKV